VLYAKVSPWPFVSKVYYPQYSRRNHAEKNWGFFEYHDDLYAVYSIGPGEHRVLKIDGESVTVEHSTEWVPPWQWGVMRDGAALSMLDECDVFITGADAVLANGNVVNKIGTHMISQAAKTQNVPHYVATSRFAFDPLTFFGWPEPIEERNSREVWPQKPSRVKVRNPAFDVTPAELVSGILSERGLLSPTLFAETMIKEMDLVGHKKEFLQWMSELDKAKKKK
jgi:hypothetical protein